VTTPPALLEVRQISKHFPGVKALDRVSLRLQAGEVLAVVGENGAGKSTLMKVLAGIYLPDGGAILLDGQTLAPGSVGEALRHGVVLIHQELNLAENLSVAANLFLGRESLWGGWLGLLSREPMRQAARKLMDQVGLRCSPDTFVKDLPPGQRQLVEIAHALALRARVLIMDEPTSSLTQRETDRLFEVITQLKRSGVAVIYISHRLGEVKRIADRATVLRDGRNAGDLTAGEISHTALVRLMVGRDLAQFYQRKHCFTEASFDGGSNPARLQVLGLCYAGGRPDPVSFSVRPGEIVGMAGLVGAGRTELAEALFGIRPVTTGTVLIDGRPVHITSPRDAIAAGLLLVPEDRRYQGLVLEETVLHNISLPNLDSLRFLTLVGKRREAALGRQVCQKLQVRGTGLAQTVGLLSGGNQQKVVLGKWLARRPHVLICDEPTRGIDVGAKGEIYALMDQLAANGVGILMISSDLEEILGVSDRVLVLHEGRLAGELSRSQLSEEAIMHLATGGHAQS
jgi:ribose transport system ATP-binding protein